ncbi:N-acetyl-gamma-glutamyl-phosphate reductase [Scleromatobacter humisilvae]|uniref:N-acetyl-gamma-glutamyl-phosphate reductase n=1 Tax=Scleromatobacter humisilvae TaxID=2897159 RepID=A0A9X1YKH2_9BURK|nr:N-acetyl-gamma-glutamyl-phosphate reductase [Scleromatobacter humisilvae]MCK9687596.1 N-acetyl-gamma-glutamyl-phosphate reductase [Scleromatobacter humisilvae]
MSTAPKKFRVYVDGQEGTTGLRIHEMLAARPDLELLRISPELRKDDAERARLLNAADVAFLCLPDEASRAAAKMITNPDTCLIDASTAHRTDPSWVYGLPELAPGQREALRTAKRIANPGCHATAFILLMRPLVDAGLVAVDANVTATSITGYSGGGKKMIEQYQGWHARQMDGERQVDAALSAPRPYALGLAHKHIPEMKTCSKLTRAPVFMPIVGNFYKGLAVSIPFHLNQFAADTDAAKVHATLAERYAGEPFVNVMPLSDPAVIAEGSFDVQACNDTQRADLFVFAGAGQVLLMARIDNLGKGASGAAVQTMNLHLGLPETLSLQD